MKALLLVPALLLAVGCGDSVGAACDRAMEQTAELRSPPEVPQVPEARSTLGLTVSSSLPSEVGITVTFDDAVALDAVLPAAHGQCTHHAVHRYGFEVPPGAVVASVVTDDGRRATTEVEVGDDPRWLVVTLQEGFPLDIETWDERPLYG